MKKVVEFKQQQPERPKDDIKEKVNKKRLTVIIMVVLLVLALAITAAAYISNKEFRNFMDKYIF